MNEPTREKLRTPLSDWKLGLTTEIVVHETAEAWLEDCEWPTLPQSDPRSITYEVLSQLDILPQQLIIAADVDAFLEFLNAPAGAEATAWAKWQAYWHGIDFDARREQLRGDPYY